MEELLGALQSAGLDFQSEEILDALWLASRGNALSLHEEAVVPGGVETARKQGKQAAGGKRAPHEAEGKGSAAGTLPGESGAGAGSRVFAGGLPSETDRTVKAAPVAIPAGQALPNRLALMRSLRPLRHRWTSKSSLEIDEEKTATASAEASVRGSPVIYPVFRPSRAPWYDVDVVMEDDPVIEVWKETIRDFCQMLRDTGAFRVVQSWKLRIDLSEDPDSDAAPPIHLETAAGTRVSTRVLGGAGTRRLIFFVTHGASTLWRDGTYAKVLAPWTREASLVLLHMLPRERWQYTHLGDCHGLCFTERAGVPSGSLNVAPFWWQAPAGDVKDLLKIPAASLDALGMGEWASMQMARGLRSPVFLLDPRQEPRTDIASTNLDSKRDFERAIAQLREASPEAFLLAIHLSLSYFTIPVARLIQEVKLGSAAHPSQLGELFLSGLVFAKARAPKAEDEAAAARRLDLGRETGGAHQEQYFGFWPQAREILMQSVREEDARSIAAELEKRVSRHIEEVSGRNITFRGLVPRQDGTYDLPEWAQPFAKVANSALGLPDAGDSPGELVQRFERSSPPSIVGAAIRAAGGKGRVSETAVGSDVFQALVTSRLLWRADNGQWDFLPGVRERLALLGRSFAGASILWVGNGIPGVRPECRALRERGAKVRQVKSAREALTESVGGDYDVVVTEWPAPGSAGPAWLHPLRDSRLQRILYHSPGFNPNEEKEIPDLAAFVRVSSPEQLFGAIAEALRAKPSAPVTLKISVKPGEAEGAAATPGAASATIRVYRHGFGDCTLLTLRGGGAPYHVLVNCGLLVGTPDAREKMSKVVEDVFAQSAAKIDVLIVTQTHWNKLSGFEQAKDIFDKCSIGEVMAGWWEKSSDAEATRMHREQWYGAGSASVRAMEIVKRLGHTRRFLQPGDQVPFGDTGASLYCLGVSRDTVVRRKAYPAQPGLDFAVELAGGGVLLFGNRINETILWQWQQPTFQFHGRSVTGLDLLARAVFGHVRLIGMDGEVFERKAMPLMPNLRTLMVPIDRATLESKRWALPVLDGIRRTLRQRGGNVLTGDTDAAPLDNEQITGLWFDLAV